MTPGRERDKRRRGLRAALVPAAATFALSALLLLVADRETASWTPPHPSHATAEPVAAVATTAEKVHAGDGREEERRATEDHEPAKTGRTAPTCDELLVLVDRAHPLPASYVPKDLVPLAPYGVHTLGGGDVRLRREAAEALRGMAAAAAADGEELVVASAYRSYAEQEAAHARLTGVYGEGAMIAPPGHSQHQLGTAVDLTNAAAGYGVGERFGETSAYAWLAEHAGEHGFVLAYPLGGEEETGYGWEPWHYRHVGAENAGRIARSGVGLQGFLSAEGVAPRC